MKPKILVVDDEPDALEVLGFKLKEAGYLPIFAKDGGRAITATRDLEADTQLDIEALTVVYADMGASFALAPPDFAAQRQS